MATLSDHILAAAQMEDAHVAVTFHPSTKEEASTLIRRIGGRFTKNSYQGSYWVTQRDEKAGCNITIFIPSMCQRVQVGETVLPETVCPAVTIPKYEYQCEQLFEVDG